MNFAGSAGEILKSFKERRMGEESKFVEYSKSYQEKVSALLQANSLDTAMSLAVGGGFNVIGKLEFLLLRQFGLLPTDSLIDVGCGSGRLAVQLLEYSTGDYLGTDVVEDLISFAKEKCTKSNFEFAIADDIYLPKEDCSTDFICFFSVLTHLSHVDSYRYLMEASRALREGGKIVFSFLEFKIGQHWNVFENALNNTSSTCVHDQFISRDAISAWASHLGLEVVFIEDGNKYFIEIPDFMELNDPHLTLKKFGRLGQSVCVLKKPLNDFDSHTFCINEETIKISLKIKKSKRGKEGNVFVAAIDRDTDILYSVLNENFTKIHLQDLQPVLNVVYGEHCLVIKFGDVDKVACKYLDIYVGYGLTPEEMVSKKSFFFVHTIQTTQLENVADVAYHQVLLEYATHDNYSADEYLAANPDVERSFKNGDLESEFDHFVNYGIKERRYIRKKVDLVLKNRKIEKIKAVVDSSIKFLLREEFLDFINLDQSKKIHELCSDVVSDNMYDENALALINKNKNGLVLDCGSGRRSIYYENVVNMDIFPYDTVDVVAYAEEIPFIDGTFDAVICLAVLEHVKNPFKCAKELIRVLKPGGNILCAVPFLQPFHAYPDHYYNMTSQGLINLFNDGVDVEKVDVYGGFLPIGSLTWILRSWSDGLADATRADFLNMRVRDLVDATETYLDKPFVRELSKTKNLELASATALFGKKKR
jgi:ubiquinone/menaquinone biosynthesis C-methylase UbiE